MRLNFFLILMLVVLGLLQYRLWYKPTGIKDMISLKEKLTAQAAEIQALKQKNEELLFHIKRLQNGKDGAEARARNELGMIKKDETFYQVVK